jgi:translation elongation factor EF-G
MLSPTAPLPPLPPRAAAPQVPRLVFVNKLDRVGANPFRVIQQARDKLKLNAAAVQVRESSVGRPVGRYSILASLVFTRQVG